MKTFNTFLIPISTTYVFLFGRFLSGGFLISLRKGGNEEAHNNEVLMI